MRATHKVFLEALLKCHRADTATEICRILQKEEGEMTKIQLQLLHNILLALFRPLSTAEEAAAKSEVAAKSEAAAEGVAEATTEAVDTIEPAEAADTSEPAASTVTKRRTVNPQNDPGQEKQVKIVFNLFLYVKVCYLFVQQAAKQHPRVGTTQNYHRKGIVLLCRIATYNMRSVK